MPKFLMCPPQHYRVDYSINPWMNPSYYRMEDRSANRTLAFHQWDKLYEAMYLCGADIELIEQAPACPDMVFTANAGLVIDHECLTSSFKHVERQKEQKYFEEYFKILKGRKELIDVRSVWDVQIDQLSMYRHSWQPIYFEGAGDAIFDPYDGVVWMGHGFRTQKIAADIIRDQFRVPVVPLELCDPHFYHLDTCFAVLPEGYIMGYPGAFKEPFEFDVVLSKEDASIFSANVVCVDDAVIGSFSFSVRDQLLNLGLNPIMVDLSMFHKAGGSAACLALRLDHVLGD